jgi:hypothetical protein
VHGQKKLLSKNVELFIKKEVYKRECWRENSNYLREAEVWKIPRQCEKVIREVLAKKVRASLFLITTK